MSDDAASIADATVALPESRELDTLARMMEAKGAQVIRCPLVAIHDAEDAAPIEAWLKDLVSGTFDDLILMTGEGVNRLLGFAERASMRPAVEEALGKVRKITRGPKPSRALRKIGLGPDLPAAAPTTDGIIETLSSEHLQGRRVAVQMYGQVPNEKLLGFLREAGATVAPVAPYVYAPDSDTDRVIDLIDRMNRGEVTVVAFTSASQVDRLWQVAEKSERAEALRKGIARTLVAGVGPVVNEALEQRGVEVAVSPSESFFMKPLVTAIAQKLSSD
ncbi:bifunctional uroporphyrinogen-III synthetase/response regulator domain protein [Planctomycetes bacterium Pan216]|uniref:Bifunctional uroporphyrinogen-III synthetase/response regulator domain protein n=1 Tax=Kolteria novifilia TaxID=2527975 RepID=A0A518B0J2_9BACT|nr:bifunctional uroporphyrinogen-III synthetase/response regulator domain protein [Planctomycetes bacterium Pan216]